MWMDLQHTQIDQLHATSEAHGNYCKWMIYSPWWLHSSDQPKNCPKLCALASRFLLIFFGWNINSLKLWMNPIWYPLGGCAPPRLWQCALVIPLTESTDICLEMCALTSSILGQKGFPRSDPKIPLGTQTSLLKCCTLPSCLMRRSRFHR